MKTLKKIEQFMFFGHYFVLCFLVMNILLRTFSNFSINISHNFLIYTYLILGSTLFINKKKLIIKKKVFYFITIIPFLISTLVFITYFENKQYAIKDELNGIVLFEKWNLFLIKIGNLTYDECAINIYKPINKIEFLDKKTLLINDDGIMVIDK